MKKDMNLVRLYEKEFGYGSWSATAGTTGTTGGDGSVTIVEFRTNSDFFDIQLVRDNDFNVMNITCVGDNELTALIESIEFVLSKLKLNH